VGCCVWPCQVGSNVGMKKGRRSAAEAFIVARRGGGRVVGRATWRRGLAEGRWAGAVVGRRGVGPCYSPGQRRFEYNSNSNEFKLL
jgi:hypothetical protein